MARGVSALKRVGRQRALKHRNCIWRGGNVGEDGTGKDGIEPGEKGGRIIRKLSTRVRVTEVRVCDLCGGSGKPDGGGNRVRSGTQRAAWDLASSVTPSPGNVPTDTAALQELTHDGGTQRGEIS